MYTDLFSEFKLSSDTLRVYEGDQLIFPSTKDRAIPLLEYIDRFASLQQHEVFFNKIMGNAAALLCVKVEFQGAYRPLGSQLAADTLDKSGIKYKPHRNCTLYPESQQGRNVSYGEIITK